MVIAHPTHPYANFFWKPITNTKPIITLTTFKKRIQTKCTWYTTQIRSVLTSLTLFLGQFSGSFFPNETCTHTPCPKVIPNFLSYLTLQSPLLTTRTFCLNIPHPDTAQFVDRYQVSAKRQQTMYVLFVSFVCVNHLTERSNIDATKTPKANTNQQ